MLLERRQREALERIARQKGHSINELVPTYVTMGLNQENSPQVERLQALENARALKQTTLMRRGGRPLPDLTTVMDNVRDERTNELLGH